MTTETQTFRRVPGCVIRENRFYICRRNPPVSVVDQPKFGFTTEQEAMDWLAAKITVASLDLFVAVPADQIA